MEQVVKLTVRLPAKLHELLKQRAQSEVYSLNKTIIETLWQGLAETPYEQLSERQKLLRVIRESGLLDPLGPEWQEEIAKAPNISHAELREKLSDIPPLSEAIIEEREPR
jgi:hypothetical protein